MLTVNLDRLGLKPRDWLLDAGCGGGRHCFGALDRGVHTVGLDLDAPSLRIARAGIHERRGRAPGLLHGGVLRGDVFHLPFRDGCFDRVICSEVMEHVHDWRGAARELARVVKPEGKVAITIPTATSEQLYLRLGDDYFESPGGHIRIFSPRTLARGLLEVGLATTGVGFAHALHTPYWALRSIAGLPKADQSRLVRAYRSFLLRATQSPLLERLEKALNYVCPKSVVLYAEKSVRAAAPAS